MESPTCPYTLFSLDCARAQERDFESESDKLSSSGAASIRIQTSQETIISSPLQWRHNERDGVSNPHRLDCILNRLTGEFPAQRASKAEKVSIWWRHHVTLTDWDISPFPPFDLIYFTLHDDVIKWKHFPRYWTFVQIYTLWIPLTKASDAKLWCFLWSAPV